MTYYSHKNPPRKTVQKKKSPKLLIIILIIIIVGGLSYIKLMPHIGLLDHKDSNTITQNLDQIRTTAKLQADQYNYIAAINTLNTYKDQNNTQIVQDTQSYKELNSKLVTFTDISSVSHLFFHSLIVDPAIAFKSSSSAGYNDYMVTIQEFNKILQTLYNRNFVLISPHDIGTFNKNNNWVEGKILLPSNKIPLVMSQDDVNYYYYMQGTGFADKLVVGPNGKPTCQYTDKNGNITTGDYDLIPVLDTFLSTHPSFSYHGAKAIIGETGYNGALGYRSQSGAKNRESEIEKAKVVADAIKKDGYEFASHSYGHIACGKVSPAELQKDTNMWKQEVEPIVGKTNLFIYPFGNDIAGTGLYSGAKYKTLQNAGFKYFFNVDASQPAWNQFHQKYMREARINIDGYRMYYTPELISKFFNAKKVFDNRRPLPVPPI
jgi:hypothetical protein